MEKEAKITNKVSYIQTHIVCPKKQYNKFGEYYYRSLEDIFEAVRPLLEELNVSIGIDDEIILVGDRYYVAATASIVDADGKVLASSKGWAREELEKKKADASQLTGSASSYARKYAISGLLCLNDIQDADEETSKVDKVEVAGSYKYDLRKLGDEAAMTKAVEFFRSNGVEAVIGENNEVIVTLPKPLARLKNCEIN